MMCLAKCCWRCTGLLCVRCKVSVLCWAITNQGTALRACELLHDLAIVRCEQFAMDQGWPVGALLISVPGMQHAL